MHLFRTSMLVGLAATSLWGCKSFEGATVNVTPNPLEVHADSIKYSIKGAIPPGNKMKKGGIYKGDIVIKQGPNIFAMSSIEVAQSKYPDIKKKGAEITIEGTNAYDPGMNAGKMVAVNSYQRKSKKFELPELELAPCCITTSQLVCATEQFLVFCENNEKNYQIEKNSIKTEHEARFEFPQDVDQIRMTEYDKSEIRAIGEFLLRKTEVKRIIIEGFASPEGPVKRNKTLSVGRLREVQNWLVEQLKKEGYTIYNDSTFFTLRSTTEDWEGFKANLDRTTYSEDDKRKIIEIVGSNMKDDLKEKKVMALVGGAAQVEYILAPLRRATIRLEFNAVTHTDDQIRAFLNDFVAGRKNSMDLKNFFKQEELLYGVSKLDKPADRRKVLAEYVKLFPDDYRGHNDLGVYAYLTNDAAEGEKSINAAKAKRGNDAFVLNNEGVLIMAKGNRNEALAKFKDSYAQKNSPEAAFNIGVIYARQAKYKEAAQMFDAAGKNLKCGLFNAGLCKLLLNDLTGAKKDGEEAIRFDKNHALSYYLLALVGARASDNSTLTLNLKRSVQLDNNLSKRALDDLEFRKVRNTPEFNLAVQPK
jgi:outer membrane protein OmpA-like peptidoglycan-associated protein/tetratricopeptide (TPR) repeat protein